MMPQTTQEDDSMDVRQTENKNKAVWQFRFLDTIMSEIPLSNTYLAQTGLAQATIRKLRSGQGVTYSKCIEARNVISTNEKARAVIEAYQDELIVPKSYRGSEVTREKILATLNGRQKS